MYHFMLTMDREKLCNISNSNCLLVEFVNEGNLLGVGYCSWLHDYDLENIYTIIENKTNTIIYWPNVDVTSAASMKTALNKADFEQCSVIILSTGTWQKMSKELNSLIKCGLTSPNKKQRKQISKKSFNDSDFVSSCNNLTHEASVELDPIDKELSELYTRTKNTRASNEMLNNIELLNRISNSSRKEPQEAINAKEQAHVSQVSENALYDSDNEEAVPSDVANDSDEESHEIFLRKDREIDKLQTENTKLKQKVEKQAEEIVRLKNTNQKLKKENDDLKNSQKESNSRQKLQLSSECLKQIQELAQEGLDDIASEVLRDSTNKKINRKRELSPTSNDSGHQAVKENMSYRGTTAKQNNFVIDDKMKLNCRKNTLENYTNDLLDCVFTEEELANSSVTGVQCNANKGLGARPGLDPARLQAVKDAVFSKFGKNKLTKTTFNYVAKNKCGSKRPGKKIKPTNTDDN